MPLCGKCKNRHVRPDDNYCSMCRNFLGDVSFEGGTDRILIENIKEFEVHCRVKNIGQIPIDLIFPDHSDKDVRFKGLPLTKKIVPDTEEEFCFTACFTSEKTKTYSLRYLVNENARDDCRVLFYRASNALIIINFLTDSDNDEIEIVGNSYQNEIEIKNDGGSSAKIAMIEVPEWMKVHKEMTIPPYSTITVNYSVEVPENEFKFINGTILYSICTNNEISRESIDTPQFVRYPPPDPKIFLLNEAGETENVDSGIYLGSLIPCERKRVKCFLRNHGGTALKLKGFYTSYGKNNPAFFVRHDTNVEDISNAIKIEPNGNLDFHICIDASYYGHDCTVNAQIVFDFENYGILKIPVQFTVPLLKEYEGLVAIDFGTSYSCLAESPSILSPAIPLDSTRDVVRDIEDLYMPSVLYFFSPDDYVFGREAKKVWYPADPGNGVANLKRALIDGERSIRGAQFTTTKLIGIFMRELISVAARWLNAIPIDLVITVPVGFSEHQRDIIRKAIHQIPLGVEKSPIIDVVDEPTAAAMHYYTMFPEEFHDADEGKPIRMLVFDFGGGTLDVSVLEFTGGHCFTLLSRRGDARLGGIDLDHKVAVEMSERTKKAYPGFASKVITLKRKEYETIFGTKLYSIKLRNSFREKSEKVKIMLSSNLESVFKIERDELYDYEGRIINDAKSFEEKITPTEYEVAINDRIERSISIIETAIHASKLNPQDIQLVLMTGQVSKTECIRKRIREYFQNTGTCIVDKADFDLKSCVALGAVSYIHHKRKGEFKTDCDSTGIGSVGYIDIKNQFVTILEDKHRFGTESTVPIIRKKKFERDIIEIIQNLGFSQNFSIGDSNFVLMAKIEITTFKENYDDSVCLFLGLDFRGALTARVDSGECRIVWPEDRDEVW